MFSSFSRTRHTLRQINKHPKETLERDINIRKKNAEGRERERERDIRNTTLRSRVDIPNNPKRHTHTHTHTSDKIQLKTHMYTHINAYTRIQKQTYTDTQIPKIHIIDINLRFGRQSRCRKIEDAVTSKVR